jgi:adenosylmethionine-8-amino-7-oxononanoate aminotransferase
MNGISRETDLARKDKSVLMHPFTRLSEWQEEDLLIIDRAEGSYLFDGKGNAYLDGTSSLWVNLLGHRHPALDKALRKQIDSMAHSTFLGLSHEGAILLGEDLLGIAPKSLSRVFYSDNGSTAVEIGLKIAFLSRNTRPGSPSAFLSLTSAYHGDTLGSVGIGGIERFHDMFRPLIRESLKAPAPDCFHCPLGLRRDSCSIECADVAIEMLKSHRDDLCGIVLEPLLQAAGGMIVWPEGYLGRVSKAAREFDVPLILDEVATGFGRTGTLFACQKEGVEPDILCLGKGLTGGYLPLAATLFSAEIYRKLEENPGIFYHGHSYTANPLAVAVSRATIRVLKDENPLSAIPGKQEIYHRFRKRLEERPGAGNHRHIGLVFAFDVFKGRAPADPPTMKSIRVAAQNKGLIIRPLNNTLYLIPPLSVTNMEFESMCGILEESVNETMASGG